MTFQAGDRVVAESESIERPARYGTVREVVREDPRARIASSGTTGGRACTRRRPARSGSRPRPPSRRGDAGRRCRAQRFESRVRSDDQRADRVSSVGGAQRTAVGDEPVNGPKPGFRRGGPSQIGVSPGTRTHRKGLHWGRREVSRSLLSNLARLAREGGGRAVPDGYARPQWPVGRPRARPQGAGACGQGQRAREASAARVAARERSAARHDRHAETLEAHGAKRAAAAERRDAQLDRDAADAARDR